jgi:hypothetical protein
MVLKINPVILSRAPLLRYNQDQLLQMNQKTLKTSSRHGYNIHLLYN